ncbi:unnamed protein product, partial [Ectocarpus sp. 12 AP-2014]
RRGVSRIGRVRVGGGRSRGGGQSRDDCVPRRNHGGREDALQGRRFQGSSYCARGRVASWRQRQRGGGGESGRATKGQGCRR